MPQRTEKMSLDVCVLPHKYLSTASARRSSPSQQHGPGAASVYTAETRKCTIVVLYMWQFAHPLEGEDLAADTVQRSRDSSLDR